MAVRETRLRYSMRVTRKTFHKTTTIMSGATRLIEADIAKEGKTGEAGQKALSPAKIREKKGTQEEKSK